MEIFGIILLFFFFFVILVVGICIAFCCCVAKSVSDSTRIIREAEEKSKKMQA